MGPLFDAVVRELYENCRSAITQWLCFMSWFGGQGGQVASQSLNFASDSVLNEGMGQLSFVNSCVARHVAFLFALDSHRAL